MRESGHEDQKRETALQPMRGGDFRPVRRRRFSYLKGGKKKLARRGTFIARLQKQALVLRREKASIHFRGVLGESPPTRKKAPGDIRPVPEDGKYPGWRGGPACRVSNNTIWDGKRAT